MIGKKSFPEARHVGYDCSKGFAVVDVRADGFAAERSPTTVSKNIFILSWF
jgi:hypothetical protein